MDRHNKFIMTKQTVKYWSYHTGFTLIRTRLYLYDKVSVKPWTTL